MMYSNRVRKCAPRVLCVLLSWGFAHSQETEALANRLNVRLEGETHVNGQDLVHAITQLNTRLAVPLGLEVTKTPEMFVPFSRTWKDATVRQVIDDVVNAYPTYRVRYESGVVQIQSKRVPLERGASILDIQISSFTAQNEIVARVSRRLHKMAQKAVANEKIEEQGSGDAGSIGVGAGGDTKVTLTVTSGPLRTALNALAREAKQMWIVAYPEQPNTMNGYLEMAYVNVKSRVSNDQQPVWLLIPYDIAIVSRAE